MDTDTRKRHIGVTGLMLVALLLGSIGGGLVGGAVGFSLAQPEQEAVDAAEVTSVPTTVALSTQTGSVTDLSSDAIVATVGRTAPAVVTVVNSFGGGQRSTGSGVIISQDGYLITNNHVVENQERLQVIYADGSFHEAELIGTDPFADLAVVRVKDEVPAVAELGDSDQLQPGQTVIAIGSPLGEFQNSVTVGVVSALDRIVGPIEGLIQTDAAINQGNSGGPLIDVHGNVVGINTLVVRGSAEIFGPNAEGLGFAVPANTVRQVSDALIANGRVARPYLGVDYELLTPEDALTGVNRDHGALLTDIADDGPARRAGLLRGDVVTAINGEQITTRRSLLQVLSQYQPGDTVALRVLRDTQEQDVQITLIERPNSDSTWK